MNGRHRALLAIGLIAMAPVAARANPAAFRLTDLDWREPHFMVNVLGCRDITDTQLVGFSINSNMQTAIQTDADMDGNLDQCHLIVFNPLDQAASTGQLVFGEGHCTAPPAGTTCDTQGFPTAFGTFNNMPVVCLAPLAGTTRPYSPAITSSQPPCFVALLGTVTLNIAGIPVTLHDTYLAATYNGAPATGLVNGLIRGFVPEAEANNTIVPASMPLFGGQPLSSLWPGGTGCCAAHSDKDMNNGVTGWYCYLNFVASPVTYTGPTPVHDTSPLALALDSPAPNPFNPDTTIRYILPAAGTVRLTVYDGRGHIVARLVDEYQDTGMHAVTWNGRDTRGATVSSGVYYARMEANGELRTTKMALLR